MKTVITCLLVCLILSQPYLHAEAPREPQMLLAVAIVLDVAVVGIVGYIFWDKITDHLADWFLLAGGLWDKVFNKPPPEQPPPDTNDVRRVSTTLPLFRFSVDPHAVAYRPIATNGWVDVSGGCTFTNVLQTTVQCRESCVDPWTNFFTMTIWDSRAGSLALFRNPEWSPIYTSYVFRARDGSAHHHVPQSVLDDPKGTNKFYRFAAIPK